MTEVSKIKRHPGVAGQYSYSAEVSYPGEDGPPARVSFVGSVYGGPIVAISPSGVQSFVRNPERFGATLDESWVRAFFGEETTP